MPNTKVSALAAFTDLADADIFYAVDGSTSKKITWAALKAEIVAEIVAGKQGIWIPASALVPQTTSGPGTEVTESSTYKNMSYTLDFDSATVEYANFQLGMPKMWDEGTITAQFYWSHGATATNFGVTWGMHAAAISDGDVLDADITTAAAEIADTGGTTGTLYISDETAALTIGGTPAEGDMVQLEFYRNVVAGTDTMAIDAKLHGIKLFITTTAGTDA